MDIRFTFDAVAHVPVYYWPWVWWQLFWLRGWAEATERELVYQVAASGRVHVIFLSDEKTDLRAWMSARTDVRRPHLDMCDNAAGARGINWFILATARAFERTGHLVRLVWVRIVLRAVPPFKDSS